jgi:hypothetical protein
VITKATKIEIALLVVQKWEHIAAKYKASGDHPPPFVVQQLEAARKLYAELTPQQAKLL